MINYFTKTFNFSRGDLLLTGQSSLTAGIGVDWFSLYYQDTLTDSIKLECSEFDFFHLFLNSLWLSNSSLKTEINLCTIAQQKKEFH